VPATVTRRRPPSATASPERLSFAEHVCLVLIVQGVSHGWALGTELASEGDIGRVWTLTRPLTYRAVDGLIQKGLVIRRGHASGQGRDRIMLAATAAGRRTAACWLDTPVEHLRDVRTELLVKLTLRTRAGLDNHALLVAQRAALTPTIDVLTSVERVDDPVDLWRRESARAVRRFLDQALQPAPVDVSVKPELRISARNQLRGTLTAVQHGEAMSTIKAVLDDGQPLTAVITREAAEDLDLAPGDRVVMVVKSTEVMVAKVL
jgi:PadR family transcriptional regulator AphA